MIIKLKPPEKISLELSCDLYFRIKHAGGRKDRLLCRFALNPAFIKDSIVLLNKKDLDPDKITKNPKYEEDFRIEIHFRDVCKVCKSTNELKNLCNTCR